MRKFDIRTCSCGRIHAIPYKTLEETCYSNGENNKDIALVCGGCGHITIIGADYTSNYYDDSENPMIYDCYARTFISENIQELAPEVFNKPTKIIHSKGYRVPMLSGEYANYRDCTGTFEDTNYPNFFELDKVNITSEEVHQFIEDFHTKRTTVNMVRFIREIPDDVLEALSHYGFKSFDWSGTKYENEFNA